MIGNEPKYLSFYAMAVIITTILFKLILLPVSFQQSKSSKKMAELQPSFKEIQKNIKMILRQCKQKLWNCTRK